jgi:hypothetical protein
MPRKNIQQLATASDISTNDLLVNAIPDIDNHKVQLKEFADYLKNYSGLLPLDLTGKYVNFNNIDTSVKQTNIADIESLSFNEYGIISNITLNNNIVSEQLDLYSGYIDTTYIPGYFDRYTPIRSDKNRLISDVRVHKTTHAGVTSSDSWEVLFDTEYTNYRKTIVSYIHERADTSNSLEPAGDFKIYIYWDGNNNTKIQGTGIIRYTSQGQIDKTATILYPFQPLLNNRSYAPVGLTSGDTATKTKFNLLSISVDGANKKILRLPISPFVPISG